METASTAFLCLQEKPSFIRKIKTMLKYKSLMADMLTPVSAFLRVAGKAERAFLLESVEGGENIARFSFIGVDPDSSFTGSLERFRKIMPEPEESHPDLPPFTGGAVGYFAYEMIRELEDIPETGNTPLPYQKKHSVAFDFYSTVLAFDHVKQQIIIMSREGDRKIQELEERLMSDGFASSARQTPDTEEIKLTSNFSRDDYLAAVERSKEYIKAGDIFQVVLSQRFETDYSGDPFQVYRALRYVNPSPYMFYLKQGDLCIAGSSPEMLVKANDKSLEYRPIAGTRKRGRNPEHERELEADLINDEKEKAEHLMLVDLGRNDLGRVSEYGSVKVEKFMYLEKYSHVMHLVSRLRGNLRDDLDCFDALKACFPAGTVTGAPKIRAMEIIEELEPSSRGVYAGAVGYLDFAGNLDTCIGIRTIAMYEGKAYLQAGGGIVADSKPELEYKESINKAQALVKALELAKKL